MYDRRTFLQVGAVASSLLIGAAMEGFPAGARALGVAGPRKIDLYKVFWDPHHPAAVAFGQAAGVAGLTTEAIVDGDVTSLWYDDLYHRWRKGPAAIAGMTPVRVAFCLELLGQDAGLRMIYRAQHTPTPEGRLMHELVGPKSVIERSALLNAESGWASAAAQLVSRCPAERAEKSTAAFSSASASGFACNEALVSWVLAPVTRV